MLTKETLDVDLKRFEEMRFQALFDIRNPEAALLNYHRCDAVMAYIKELQGRQDKQAGDKEKADG